MALLMTLAFLLAVAALLHPFARERRWLVAALLFSAGGDFFLALPWWKPSFVLGLGSFLVAHLCYLGARLPLRGRRRPRAIAAACWNSTCRNARWCWEAMAVSRRWCRASGSTAIG